MRLPYDLIIFDLEANQPSGKIIEIGAVRLSRTFTLETPGFSSFVNPNEEVTDYIKQLCCLTPTTCNKIYNAKQLAGVNNDFYTWATQTGKNIILASWGNYDVSELHIQDPDCQFRRKSLDVKSIAAWEMARWGIKATNSLSSACNAFGVEIVGPQHRAYSDALTTANLMQALWAKNTRFKQALHFASEALA